MSGYQKGYSESHSPTYLEGLAAGESDEQRIKRCPPLSPMGPQKSGAMYKRGYESAFTGLPHRCNDRCKRGESSWHATR